MIKELDNLIEINRSHSQQRFLNQRTNESYSLINTAQSQSMTLSANASVEREPNIQSKKEDEYFDEKVHEVVL